MITRRSLFRRIAPVILMWMRRITAVAGLAGLAVAGSLSLVAAQTPTSDFSSAAGRLEDRVTALEMAVIDLDARLAALEAPTTTTTLATTTTTTAVTTTTAPTTTTTTAATTTSTTAPTTTTVPPTACIGVQVAAGANLVTVLNANPAGSTFCLAAGTYTAGAALPFQSGDRLIGALGSGNTRRSIITGTDTTAYLVTATTTNVILRNVIVERFANALQQGVNAGAQTAWLVDNVELRFNRAFGWQSHDDTTIRNSWIHHNHQAGLAGQGDRVLIEGNLIEWNNWLGEHDWGWEAGGSKWVNTVGLTVRGNTSRNNCGPGLWTDGSNTGVVYENNVLTNNHGPGIFHEIGGSAVIRNNTASGNAWGNIRSATSCVASGITGGYGGGILIADSRDVEAFGNVLSDNDGGIVVINDARGAGVNVINLNIHDNDITDGAASGYPTAGCLDVETGSVCYDAASNNRWTGNDYHVGGESAPFHWLDARRSFAQWQSYGFDLTGSID